MEIYIVYYDLINKFHGTLICFHPISYANNFLDEIDLHVTDEFSDDLLPNCDELTEDEIESGFACSNETIFKEPRYNDPIFERLFAQLWQDYQISMNTRSSLYGMLILRCEKQK